LSDSPGLKLPQEFLFRMMTTEVNGVIDLIKKRKQGKNKTEVRK